MRPACARKPLSALSQCLIGSGGGGDGDEDGGFATGAIAGIGGG